MRRPNHLMHSHSAGGAGANTNFPAEVVHVVWLKLEGVLGTTARVYVSGLGCLALCFGLACFGICLGFRPNGSCGAMCPAAFCLVISGRAGIVDTCISPHLTGRCSGEPASHSAKPRTLALAQRGWLLWQVLHIKLVVGLRVVAIPVREDAAAPAGAFLCSQHRHHTWNTTGHQQLCINTLKQRQGIQGTACETKCEACGKSKCGQH
jgi:hypothetical protein